mmetsp:Transcript_3364/g.10508  ORF Transcript_3364/g.10508 Transcript_3364/m.10508 type:complete len:397 (-) Transcript_3364:453-1643(-)
MDHLGNKALVAQHVVGVVIVAQQLEQEVGCLLMRPALDVRHGGQRHRQRAQHNVRVQVAKVVSQLPHHIVEARAAEVPRNIDVGGVRHGALPQDAERARRRRAHARVTVGVFHDCGEHLQGLVAHAAHLDQVDDCIVLRGDVPLALQLVQQRRLALFHLHGHQPHAVGVDAHEQDIGLVLALFLLWVVLGGGAHLALGQRALAADGAIQRSKKLSIACAVARVACQLDLHLPTGEVQPLEKGVVRVHPLDLGHRHHEVTAPAGLADAVGSHFLHLFSRKLLLAHLRQRLPDATRGLAALYETCGGGQSGARTGRRRQLQPHLEQVAGEIVRVRHLAARAARAINPLRLEKLDRVFEQAAHLDTHLEELFGPQPKAAAQSAPHQRLHHLAHGLLAHH